MNRVGICISLFLYFITFSAALGQETQVIGAKVYLIDTCEIRTMPIWKGDLIENAKRGTVLTVIAVEEDGHWYKVKTTDGKVGYVGAVWVKPDTDFINKKKAGEAKQKAIEEQLKKEKLDNCRKKHPSWSAKDCETILAGKVRIGMNIEQCKEAWGEPNDINNTTFANGTHSQWCYGDYCSSALYFENGILTAIQN